MQKYAENSKSGDNLQPIQDNITNEPPSASPPFGPNTLQTRINLDNPRNDIRKNLTPTHTSLLSIAVPMLPEQLVNPMAAASTLTAPLSMPVNSNTAAPTTPTPTATTTPATIATSASPSTTPTTSSSSSPAPTTTTTTTSSAPSTNSNNDVGQLTIKNNNSSNATTTTTTPAGAADNNPSKAQGTHPVVPPLIISVPQASVGSTPAKKSELEVEVAAKNSHKKSTENIEPTRAPPNSTASAAKSTSEVENAPKNAHKKSTENSEPIGASTTAAAKPKPEPKPKASRAKKSTTATSSNSNATNATPTTTSTAAVAPTTTTAPVTTTASTTAAQLSATTAASLLTTAAAARTTTPSTATTAASTTKATANAPINNVDGDKPASPVKKAAPVKRARGKAAAAKAAEAAAAAAVAGAPPATTTDTPDVAANAKAAPKKAPSAASKRKSRAASNDSAGQQAASAPAAPAPTPAKRVRKKKEPPSTSVPTTSQLNVTTTQPISGPMGINAYPPPPATIGGPPGVVPVGGGTLLINTPMASTAKPLGVDAHDVTAAANRYYSPMASPYAHPDTLNPSSLTRSSLSRLFTASSAASTSIPATATANLNHQDAGPADDIMKAFEELRDHTWTHLSKCVLEQAQQFDIPSLIGTLYTLRTENEKLSNKVRDLTMKRDQLQLVTARLDLPGPLLTQHLNNTSPNFSSVVSGLSTNSPRGGLLPAPSPGSAINKQPPPLVSVGPYNASGPNNPLGLPNYMDRTSPMVGQTHSSINNIKSSSISTPSPPVSALMAHSNSNRAGLITMNPSYMSNMFSPVNQMPHLGANQQGSSYYNRQ